MDGGLNATALRRGVLSGRCAGLAGALLLHGVAITSLLQYAPAREAVRSAVPLMVNLITLPPAAKPDVLAKPLPMKPVMRPLQQPRPVSPPPVLIASADAPSATPVVPPPEPAPVELVATQASAATAPAAPSALPPPEPAAVTPPGFNAAYLNNPAPHYPALARRQGHQGKVVLRVHVNASGTPERVEIRSSSGSDLLDRAARDAVSRWRFVPARQGDQSVAAWVLVPLIFTLES